MIDGFKLRLVASMALQHVLVAYGCIAVGFLAH